MAQRDTKPGRVECEACDGWGTITCNECDGQGYLDLGDIPGAMCEAIWLDMTSEPFTEQRCDRKEDAYPLWRVDGAWVCAEHKRQVTWGNGKGLHLRSGKLVAA